MSFCTYIRTFCRGTAGCMLLFTYIPPYRRRLADCMSFFTHIPPYRRRLADCMSFFTHIPPYRRSLVECMSFFTHIPPIPPPSRRMYVILHTHPANTATVSPNVYHSSHTFRRSATVSPIVCHSSHTFRRSDTVSSSVCCFSHTFRHSATITPIICYFSLPPYCRRLADCRCFSHTSGPNQRCVVGGTSPFAYLSPFRFLAADCRNYFGASCHFCR